MGRPEAFEGQDILAYWERMRDDEEAEDTNELTKGRIRTIYVKLKYGQNTEQEMADWYNLPVQFVKDIRYGRIFRNITKDIDE